MGWRAIHGEFPGEASDVVGGEVRVEVVDDDGQAVVMDPVGRGGDAVATWILAGPMSEAV
jgi:hypothetical protein